MATVDSEGEATAYGALYVRDDASRLVLVADGSARASCADTDGDGVGGLVRLAIGLRDVRSGRAFTGIISPLEGDIDESGRVKVQFSFERGEPSRHTFDGSLWFRFLDRRHEIESPGVERVNRAALPGASVHSTVLNS